MATTTTNYGLIKPAGTDKYDISVFNGNADKIDAQMKKNADAIAAVPNTYETKANAITNLSASGKVITYTKGDGTTGTITTQDTNTDTKVTQTNSTGTTAYPILLKNGTGTGTVTNGVLFDDGVTIQPSTGTVTATKFKGALEGNASTATSATSATSATKATQDGNGNVIANTYATKETVDGKQSTITGAATSITTANLTASRALVSDSSGKVGVSAVTSTELGYLDGVTSAIQTQINGKQPTITGGASTIASSNLTTSRALVSDGNGKVAVSPVTSTELGYLDGVTSAIQKQINTVNTNAATAQSTADAALPKAGGTMTGKLVAQSNADYATKQVRNIVCSTAEPTSSDGANGDLWAVYE